MDERYLKIFNIIDNLEYDVLYTEKDFFKYINNKKNKWTSIHTCSFPNCYNNSIKKSHSIQKAIIKDYIAEDNHVLMPGPFYTKENIFYDMKKIGLNNVLTFPGFCISHERLFSDFETRKTLDKDEHFELQILRTLYKDITYFENIILNSQKSYDVYKNKLVSKLNEIIKKEYNNDRIELNDIQLKNEIELVLKHGMENNNYHLKQLKELLKKFIDDEVTIYVIEIPYMIPLIIAGSANFNISINDKECTRKFITIVNLIPQKNKSLLIFCNEYNKSFEQFLDHWRQTPLMLLNLIENIIIKETDSWAIKPSVWNSININNKQQILNDVLYNDLISLEAYNYSIFNNLRAELIKVIEKDIKNGIVDNSLNLHLIEEKEKLTRVCIKPEKNTKAKVMELYNSIFKL